MGRVLENVLFSNIFLSIIYSFLSIIYSFSTLALAFKSVRLFHFVNLTTVFLHVMDRSLHFMNMNTLYFFRFDGPYLLKWRFSIINGGSLIKLRFAFRCSEKKEVEFVIVLSVNKCSRIEVIMRLNLFI